MTDPSRHIDAALGVAGSGRVRYGAAMELWRQGRIPAEVLEVYRIASAHDGMDPRALLRQEGLPQPAGSGGQSPVLGLYRAARDYLLSLRHHGAADVRAGLPQDPGAERAMPSRSNPVVDAWLPAALAAAARTRPSLAAAIGEAAGMLDWVTYDAYPPERIGEAFGKGHAFASLRGEASPFAAADFELGLFLIAPGVLYRDHCHPAPELYAPLTGPHDWRFGPGRPLIRKPAHVPVWNPARQPHLTRVGTVPFLCLFVWTRDVNQPAVVIDAEDWAKLEKTTDD